MAKIILQKGKEKKIQNFFPIVFIFDEKGR